MSPEEITAAVEEVRRRVRERYAKTVPEIAEFELPDLEPLGQARDIADGKTAAIGTVNPRRGGAVNSAIQAVKKTVARGLNWFVRDQIDFNRAAIAYMDRNIELMVEQNQSLLRVAKEFAVFRRSTAREQADMLQHWSTWRPEWEDKLERVETRALQAIRDVEAATRGREESFAAKSLAMHRDYHGALERSVEDMQSKLDSTGNEIQQRLWAELADLKAEQERMIESELRVLRRRAATPATPSEPAAQSAAAAPAPSTAFDYARFEERFRGDEAFVTENQRFYLPYFESCRRVLDLGCGRGELLALLAEQDKTVKGVDLDADALAACHEKGLDVEQVDLFEFLGSQPEGAWDGIFCAHVIEHLPSARIPELLAACRRVLGPDGVVAFETPNPGCLAIFAGDFYLDPTHEKPVPHARMHFHLQEAGFGGIEVVERHPAVEVFPELQGLDQVEGLADFRRKFFGGLDYAIIARRL